MVAIATIATHDLVDHPTGGPGDTAPGSDEFSTPAASVSRWAAAGPGTPGATADDHNGRPAEHADPREARRPRPRPRPRRPPRRGLRSRDGPDRHGHRGRYGRRVRSPGRAVPARAAGALLPDAGFAGRGRGCRPGDVPERVALLRGLRGPRVAAHLAVPDRHPGLPEGAGAGHAPAVAVRARWP